MPKFPKIFVAVADGAPRATILERVATAFKRADVPEKSRREFAANVPTGYAMTVDFIREYVTTD